MTYGAVEGKTEAHTAGETQKDTRAQHHIHLSKHAHMRPTHTDGGENVRAK